MYGAHLQVGQQVTRVCLDEGILGEAGGVGDGLDVPVHQHLSGCEEAVCAEGCASVKRPGVISEV